MEQGLSYAAYAPFLERAVAVGGLYASTTKPETVLPMMYYQMRALQREPIDRFDLHQYVNTFILDYLAKSATNLALSDFLARADLYLGDFRRTDKYMDQLHGVAPRHIHNAISQYMPYIQWAYIGDTVRMAGTW